MNRTDASPVMDGYALRKTIEWAIMARRSIRAFLPTPVPRATVESILDVARFAASGVNTQPWQVHVITGQAKDRICAAILRVNRDSASDSTYSDEEASEMFVVGMSLGFADHSHIENRLVTERAEVGSFTTFCAD